MKHIDRRDRERFEGEVPFIAGVQFNKCILQFMANQAASDSKRGLTILRQVMNGLQRAIFKLRLDRPNFTIPIITHILLFKYNASTRVFGLKPRRFSFAALNGTSPVLYRGMGHSKTDPL